MDEAASADVRPIEPSNIRYGDDVLVRGVIVSLRPLTGDAVVEFKAEKGEAAARVTVSLYSVFYPDGRFL